MAKRRVEQGPTGRQVQENVRRLATKGEHNSDAPEALAELSARTRALGRPLGTSTLSEIRTGARRVDVDDLMVLAAALGVSPAKLLLPDSLEYDAPVELSGVGETTAEMAWRWVRDGDAIVNPAPNYTGQDDNGAWLSGPVGRVGYRWTTGGSTRVVNTNADRRAEHISHTARVALRRLQERGLLPDDHPFEAFHDAFAEMLIGQRTLVGLDADD